MKIIILGAGGHGSVIADALRSNLFSISHFLDDSLSKQNLIIYGIPVKGFIGNCNGLKTDQNQFCFGIGCNSVRKKIFLELKYDQYTFINVFHKNSWVSPYATFGRGIFVNAGAIVACGTKIDDGTIINTSASVDHDCCIGKFVHIAPGSHIAGGVSIGDLTLIGIGASVIENITIGHDCIVAAGAVVINDILPGQRVAGVPARPI